MASWTEWSFYPNFGQPKTYHTGKRCFINNMNHPRSMICISENSLESSIGRKKKGKNGVFTLSALNVEYVEYFYVYSMKGIERTFYLFC